jgi:hypothetical protein
MAGGDRQGHGGILRRGSHQGLYHPADLNQNHDNIPQENARGNSALAVAAGAPKLIMIYHGIIGNI